jgi:hypothetical protein
MPLLSGRASEWHLEQRRTKSAWSALASEEDAATSASAPRPPEQPASAKRPAKRTEQTRVFNGP